MVGCGCSGYFLTHQLELAAKQRAEERAKKAKGAV
jgi:hypothetical protein